MPGCNTQNVSFAMPMEGAYIGEHQVSAGYTHTATWHAMDKIRKIEVIADESVPIVSAAGKNLASLARFVFTAEDGTESETQHGTIISWSSYRISAG
ncbi:MAG: hypothetical protein K6G58_06835 [Lachnospiraceae bacterium]|nr:hypothetical protein [Lachnospiraceae bacterium]